METIQVDPSARHKYSSIFNNCNLDWDAIYLIPHAVTLDTKTRIFQYKLIYRILYTNKSLYKMKMVDSPLCTFCQTSEESLEHLFSHCNFSLAFWRSVVLWIKSLHINIDFLDDHDIILGLTEKIINWTLLNHIIIVRNKSSTTTGRKVLYLL